MTIAIAAFRTKVLALLDDPTPSRFTANQIDAAIRTALEMYSQFKPDVQTYNIDSNGEARFALPASLEATAIVNIEWVHTDPIYSHLIPYYAYLQDNQWVVETKGMTIPVGQQLLIEYNAMHYIDGLDAASGTSVPTADENLLSMGSAGYAAASRATSKDETNNLNPGEAEVLMKQSLFWLIEFEHRLGMPSTGFTYASWLDKNIDKAY
jgi:hypothetical protein